MYVCIFIHTMKDCFEEHLICFHFTIINPSAMNILIIPSCAYSLLVLFLEEELRYQHVCMVARLFMAVPGYPLPEVCERVSFSALLGFGFCLNFMLLITVPWVNLYLKEHCPNNREVEVFS